MLNRGRKITDFFGAPAKTNAPPKPRLSDRDRTDSPSTRVWPSSRPQRRHEDTEMWDASESPSPHEPPKQPENSTLTDEQLAKKLQDEWNKEVKSAVAQAPQSTESRATSGGSFTSVNSNGSKRVFRHGQEVVGNSDSDTDSSEGLEDLDSLLRKRPSPSKAPAVSPSKPLPTRTARSTMNTREQKLVMPPVKKYKVSLSSLVEESKKDAELDRRFEVAKAKLAQTHAESAPSDYVEKTLASVVDDDEGGNKTERLMLAMKRTNVLQRDPTWHFFRDDTEAVSRLEFPSKCLSSKGWAAVFKDPSKRDHAFMAGFARHVFRYHDLPEELAAWMIDELVFFPRDEVNAEYINTLECGPGVLSSLLTPDKVNDIFRRLGAKDIMADLDTVLTPSSHPPNHPKRAIPAGVRYIVQLLRQSASDLVSDSRMQALNILLRLLFDDSILLDVALHNVIQDTIEELIERIPEADLSQNLQQIINNLLNAVEEPVLRDQLVSALPTSSPLTHRFQRRLALAFFLHPTPLTESLTSPALPAIIHDHLSTSPHFQISRDFSYSALGARMSLLDKAIGPGFSSLSFLPSATASADRSGVPTPNASTPTPPSPEEKAFNESIDLLVSRIKWISNRIVDAGTTGMDRCEAKSACQRLHYRLEGAVRTRGRRVKGVFGEGDEDEGKNVFKRWLGKEADAGRVNVIKAE